MPVIAVLVTALQATAVAGSQWGIHRLLAGLPSIDDVRRMGEMAQATVFYDAADAPAFTIFDERRFDVALADVSPHLVKALLAIEDQRFRTHAGVDVVRILGATVANLREGRLAQGGSTLTQQLARQSFLTLDKTYTRKVQEVLLALRIEHQYTKDQILELYLNKMYFGAGLYGAEAASLGYFGKPARELSVAEAALLAGLVKSPSTWAPTVNMERAVARRNVVLQAMRDQGDIDAATFDRARATEVTLRDALRRDEPFGQYFKEQVRLELIERFGRERVYQSGLRVYTTIDVEMQKAAEAAVDKSLADLSTRRQAALKARKRADPVDDAPLQAAVVALDPRTGRRARHRRRPQLQREPLQPRRAGQAAARVRLQAVRLRGGARVRLHAGQPHRPARSSRSTRCRARGRPRKATTAPPSSRCAPRSRRRATGPRCGCSRWSACRRRSTTPSGSGWATCRRYRRWRSDPAR